MCTISKFERATIAGGARGHIRDNGANIVHRVWPHQEHVAALRGGITRGGAEATKIQRRAFATHRFDARGINLDLVMLALVIERLTVQQCFEDFHRLYRAGVTRLARHRFAGQV